VEYNTIFHINLCPGEVLKLMFNNDLAVEKVKEGTIFEKKNDKFLLSFKLSLYAHVLCRLGYYFNFHSSV
jgi:hypothetical protein